MHLETWAEISLLIFGGLFSLVTVGLLGAIALAISKLANLLEKGLDKVDPVIVKTTSAIDTVQRVTTNIGAKAEIALKNGDRDLATRILAPDTKQKQQTASRRSSTKQQTKNKKHK